MRLELYFPDKNRSNRSLPAYKNFISTICTGCVPCIGFLARRLDSPPTMFPIWWLVESFYSYPMEEAVLTLFSHNQGAESKQKKVPDLNGVSLGLIFPPHYLLPSWSTLEIIFPLFLIERKPYFTDWMAQNAPRTTPNRVSGRVCSFQNGRQ